MACLLPYLLPPSPAPVPWMGVAKSGAKDWDGLGWSGIVLDGLGWIGMIIWLVSLMNVLFWLVFSCLISWWMGAGRYVSGLLSDGLSWCFLGDWDVFGGLVGGWLGVQWAFLGNLWAYFGVWLNALGVGICCLWIVALGFGWKNVLLECFLWLLGIFIWHFGSLKLHFGTFNRQKGIFF